MSTRVVIVDDQAMVRTGLASIIDGEPDLEVVGQAADGASGATLVARAVPAVALMDVRMPGTNGIEATRRISLGGGPTRVLVLTTFDLDEYVFAALRAGASGFLLKEAPAEHLVHAVRVIARGDALLSPSVTRQVVEEFARLPAPAPDQPAELARLTARERDVLVLLVRGMSNAEIADRLVVSETTVKTHVGHVLTKLGLRDRVQAVVLGYESGLVRPGGADPLR